MPALRDCLIPERVKFVSAPGKRGAIEAVVDIIMETGKVSDRDLLLGALLQREELMSTGIGLGIAVPHVRLTEVQEPVAAVGIHREGVTDYESIDGEPVRIIVMVVAGRAQHTEYIRLLAEVTGHLKADAVRDAVLAATDPQTVFDLLTGGPLK